MKLRMIDDANVAAPSAPPGVQVTGATDRTLHVIWQKPQPTNGIIQQYRVLYWRTDRNTSVVHLSVSASLRTYNITSLDPATSYSVQVLTNAIT